MRRGGAILSGKLFLHVYKQCVLIEYKHERRLTMGGILPLGNPDYYAMQYAKEKGISLEEAKSQLRQVYGDPQQQGNVQMPPVSNWGLTGQYTALGGQNGFAGIFGFPLMSPMIGYYMQGMAFGTSSSSSSSTTSFSDEAGNETKPTTAIQFKQWVGDYVRKLPIRPHSETEAK